MTLEHLWTAAPPGVLAKPLRPEFHSLLFVTGGVMEHIVDFGRHQVGLGSVLWVRPGQVQQFSTDRPKGELVLFRPDFLFPGTQAAQIADDHRAPVATKASVTRTSVERYRRLLRREYARVARVSQTTTVDLEILQHLLSVLVLSLEVPNRERTVRRDLDSRFRDLLEQDFASFRNVQHYAGRLGYSQRTLNRATQAAAGESPKQAINRRIALEARRLLAHTVRPVTTIAHELGFDDPSNFAAFFAQETNETPTGFRRRTRR